MRRRRFRNRALAAALSMAAGGLVLTAGFSSPASATPGAFDPSFGTGGLRVQSNSAGATGVAAVPPGYAAAGSVVVSGSVSNRFQVSRFTAGGALDTSFGGGQVTPFGVTQSAAYAVAVTPTGGGDVVAVGYEATLGCGGRTPVVVELTPSGALNLSFGVRGVQTVSCPPNGGQLNAVALDSSGRIVVAGYYGTSSLARSLLVARLTAAGALDPTFNAAGTTGYQVVAVGSGDSPASGVTVTSTGEIVTAGYSMEGGASYLTVSAFRSSGVSAGTPDPAFTCSTGTCAAAPVGAALANTGSVYAKSQPGSTAFAVTATAGGSVVAAGSTLKGVNPAFLLAGYSSTGAPTPGFGTGGLGLVVNSPALASVEAFNGVTFEPHTNILTAVGQLGANLAHSMVAAQYNATTGALNPAFGGHGWQTRSFGGATNGTTNAYLKAATTQYDGKVVAAGLAPVGVNAVPGIAVVRLLGPTVSVANHALVQTDHTGPVNIAFTVSVDERLFANAPVYLCASSGSNIFGTGQCANIYIPAGLTAISVTVTTNVVNTPGNQLTVSLRVLSAYGLFASPSAGIGSALLQHIPPIPPYSGYWLAAANGLVFHFGTAPYWGSTGTFFPIVAMARTPTGNGYWLVASNGAVYRFGSAGYYGSAAGLPLTRPIVGMAATPTGHGYWLVAADGGIFRYGDAVFYGSAGALPLVQPIVGMAATPDGHGYWLVAADGGIFTYGDARFLGSTGNIRLAQPIVGMAAYPGAPGYWLVARDGGIFTFGGAPFRGSAGGSGVADVVGMVANPTGQGYWIAERSGHVFQFGNAPAYGSVAYNLVAGIA